MTVNKSPVGLRDSDGPGFYYGVGLVPIYEFSKNLFAYLLMFVIVIQIREGKGKRSLIHSVNLSLKTFLSFGIF